MPGLQIGDLCERPRASAAATNLSRGSRPGLRNSSRMSPSVYMPTVSLAKPSSFTFSTSSGLAISSATVDAQRRRHLFHHGVGFGVHGGHVERVVAAADAQEAGGLLEGLGPEARHRQQLRRASGSGRARCGTATIFCAVRSLMPAT